MDAGNQARQQHGMDFEKWIKTTFFKSYHQTGYTDKWDALNVEFKKETLKYTSNFLGLPVSMKTCKYGAPIGFGDAIRQFDNTQDFLLIVGFWLSSGLGKKFLSVKAVKVTKAEWHKLFAEAVTEEELEKDRLKPEEIERKIYGLDRTIKLTSSYLDARKQAKAEKKALPKMEIVLNPKIDSKNQRRLQCSLPFHIFWEKFAEESPFKDETCKFWGKTVPLLK